jgi:hypothetical protein
MTTININKMLYPRPGAHDATWWDVLVAIALIIRRWSRVLWARLWKKKPKSFDEVFFAPIDGYEESTAELER